MLVKPVGNVPREVQTGITVSIKVNEDFTAFEDATAVSHVLGVGHTEAVSFGSIRHQTTSLDIGGVTPLEVFF
jgi:hypothetical protein